MEKVRRYPERKKEKGGEGEALYNAPLLHGLSKAAWKFPSLLFHSFSFFESELAHHCNFSQVLRTLIKMW